MPVKLKRLHFPAANEQFQDMGFKACKDIGEDVTICHRITVLRLRYDRHAGMIDFHQIHMRIRRYGLDRLITSNGTRQPINAKTARGITLP